MENNKGTFSHFGGIIRIVILVILIALTVFFVVRWARNRQQTREAQQVSQSTGAEEKQSTQESGSTPEANSSETSGDTEIPSGVSDSEAPAPTNAQNLPAAGMGSNILLIALALSAVTYIATRNGKLIVSLVRR